MSADPAAAASSTRPCLLCRGSGQIALLTSVVPCDCRRSGKLLHLLDDPISDLNLSVRTRKVLQRLGVVTVRDLLNIRRADIESARHTGPTTLKELAALFEQLGRPGWLE